MMWIFENQNIKIQKIKVSVCKTLWICGFSLWTYLCLVLGWKHWQRELMWICAFLKIITLYLKRSKLPDAKWSGFVDFYDLWSADALVAQNDVDLWILKIRNQDPKSQSNHTQNAVELWIFNMNLSRLVLG